MGNDFMNIEKYRKKNIPLITNSKLNYFFWQFWPICLQRTNYWHLLEIHEYNKIAGRFLDAFMLLYKRLCPSIRGFIHPSVSPHSVKIAQKRKIWSNKGWYASTLNLHCIEALTVCSSVRQSVRWSICQSAH